VTDPEALLDLFDETSRAIRAAVMAIETRALRERTGSPGQYALDVAADAVAIDHLSRTDARIVSEESGLHERADAELTIVLDPVDGSTNCARGISYWATSICALDADGPLAAFVVNQATGTRHTAIRGQGAFREGARLHASGVERIEQALIALAGRPAQYLRWRQFRALGCAALTLCDVAAGGIDGYVDGASQHAPWDYLGGYLICLEAGAVMRDVRGEELVTDAVDARRQLVAAATPALADAIVPAAVHR
jgi:myo-inositol-1(or 4)-monophosphatase